MRLTGSSYNGLPTADGCATHLPVHARPATDRAPHLFYDIAFMCTSPYDGIR